MITVTGIFFPNPLQLKCNFSKLSCNFLLGPPKLEEVSAKIFRPEIYWFWVTSRYFSTDAFSDVPRARSIKLKYILYNRWTPSGLMRPYASISPIFLFPTVESIYLWYITTKWSSISVWLLSKGKMMRPLQTLWYTVIIVPNYLCLMRVPILKAKPWVRCYKRYILHSILH